MALPAITGGSKRISERENILVGEGGCTFIKEVLGWILETEAGIVILQERNLEELLTLVDIPATQRSMGIKDLECIVGKLQPRTSRCQGWWPTSFTFSAC